MSNRLLYSIFIFLISLGSQTMALADPHTITVLCPDTVNADGKGSWGDSTHFVGYTHYDDQGQQKTLTLSGDNLATAAGAMSSTSWTDQTFVCSYGTGIDVVTIATNELTGSATKCAFPGGLSWCKGSSEICPMTCEME